MQEKLAVTVLVITLALFGLAVKLYMLVDEKNEEYTEIVLNQQSSYNSRTLPYRRGDIVDRNGTYLVFQIGCYRNGTVAVGVRFYNAKEFHALR